MPIAPRVRRIGIIALVSLAVLVAGAWLARNAIATAVARSVASRLLGVEVSIEAVRLHPFGLSVEVEGLRVANPEGWGTPLALSADRIELDLSGDSSSSMLVVDLVALRGVELWFIQDGKRSNISQLVDNLSSKEAKPTEPAAAGPSMDLLIRRLELERVAVHVTERSAIIGDLPIAVRLDRVEVRDIRGKTAGKDLAEQLVGQVFEATMLAVVSQAGGKIPDAIGKGIGSSIEAGGRFGSEAVDAVGKAAKGAGEAVGGLIEGIGGAFGGKKPGAGSGK